MSDIYLCTVTKRLPVSADSEREAKRIAHHREQRALPREMHVEVISSRDELPNAWRGSSMRAFSAGGSIPIDDILPHE